MELLIFIQEMKDSKGVDIREEKVVLWTLTRYVYRVTDFISNNNLTILYIFDR